MSMYTIHLPSARKKAIKLTICLTLLYNSDIKPLSVSYPALLNIILLRRSEAQCCRC